MEEEYQRFRDSRGGNIWMSFEDLKKDDEVIWDEYGFLKLQGDVVLLLWVRPGKRGEGIGTKLVNLAQERFKDIYSVIEPKTFPFWEKIGFRNVTENLYHRKKEWQTT